MRRPFRRSIHAHALAVIAICAAPAAAQNDPPGDEAPLDKMLALLRAPDLARERLPELEQRWRSTPSFLAGAELLAACESARMGERVLELLPAVLAQPHDFAGEQGLLALDAAAMVRAFGANELLQRASAAEQRGDAIFALRDVARGEATLAGLAVPKGESPLPLVESNLLHVRAALLRLEISVLFASGGHRLARAALEEREAVLRSQLELVPADAVERRGELFGKLAECAALRAEIERVEGRRDRANEILGEARGLIGAIEAPPAETVALVSEIEGLVAEDRGAVALAEEHYRTQLRALDSLGRTAPAGERADALRCLGDLARRRGACAEALELYDRASREVASEGEALRSRHEAQLAYRRSLCLAHEARGPEAQAELERCFVLLETQHRAAPQLGTGGVFGLSETRLVAEEWLRQQLAHGEPDKDGKALAAIERVRARGLLGALDAPALAREPSTSPDARVAALRTAALFGSDADAGQVRAELAIAVAKLERARAASTRPGAGYRATWFEDVQKLLRAEDGRALVYFLGQEGLWIWWLDGRSAQHRRIAIGPAVLEDEVRALQRALAAPPAEGQGPERLRRALDELRSTLLPEPFDRDLRGAITIVPDGPLHLFPWSLLLLDRAQSLRVVPSLHARLEIRERESGSAEAALLVAAAAPVEGLSAPLAAREIDALEKLYGERARSLRDAAATPASVLALLAQADLELAHFAVHGVVDPLFPSSSGLALAGGYLWPEDVLALERVPPLVVLNACSSGRGERSSSEGVIGVARAFLERGASSVIATLWDVDDAAALLFAERFHERLRGGDSEGFALLEAQRAVRARFADPSAWAAFTLIGDGGQSSEREPARSGSGSTAITVLLALGSIAAGLLILLKARSPRRADRV